MFYKIPADTSRLNWYSRRGLSEQSREHVIKALDRQTSYLLQLIFHVRHDCSPEKPLCICQYCFHIIFGLHTAVQKHNSHTNQATIAKKSKLNCFLTANPAGKDL